MCVRVRVYMYIDQQNRHNWRRFGFVLVSVSVSVAAAAAAAAAVLQLFPINDKNHMTRTGRRSGFVFCSFSLGRALFLSPLRFSIWRRRH